MQFIPLIAISIGLYFLMIRPQQRKLKAQRELVQKAQVNDEIMMTSGIYGVITEIDGEVAYVEIAPDIEIKVQRAAISKVVPQHDAKAADSSASSSPDANKPKASALKAALESGRPAEQAPKKFGWAKK